MFAIALGLQGRDGRVLWSTQNLHRRPILPNNGTAMCAAPLTGQRAPICCNTQRLMACSNQTWREFSPHVLAWIWPKFHLMWKRGNLHNSLQKSPHKLPVLLELEIDCFQIPYHNLFLIISLILFLNLSKYFWHLVLIYWGYWATELTFTDVRIFHNICASANVAHLLSTEFNEKDWQFNSI